MIPSDEQTRLKYFIYLMAIHSVAVALGLIFLPTKFLTYFGINGYSGRFFQMQSGVFHIVMSIAYLYAVIDLKRSPAFVYFAIYAKSIATVFLLSVFFLSESGWVIIVSAFGDAAMAIILFFLYSRYKKTVQSPDME